MTKQQESIEYLRGHLHPGETIYTVLRGVSASGMTRYIDLYMIRNNVPLRITWSVADATGYTYNLQYEAIRINGSGLNVGHAVVQRLGEVLYPDGFTCTGWRSGELGCPGADHIVQDVANVTHHANGGRAFRQNWI